MITEYEFMKQNINYYVEKDIPNFQEMVIRSAKEHIAFMNEMESKFGKIKKQKQSICKRIKHYFAKR